MIAEIITICSLLIIVIGWFINNHLNRKNDIAKVRFEYRMNALKKFLNVYFFIQKNSTPFADPLFLPLLEETRTLLSLYGEDDEINLYEEFIHACECRDLQKANTTLDTLVVLVRLKVRKELNLKVS